MALDSQRFKAAAKSVNKQLPILPYLGLGLWMAWNITAFSGVAWLEDIENTWRAADLFAVHLGTSVVTLVLIGIFHDKIEPLLARAATPLSGGLIASLGAVVIILARPSMVGNQTLFFVGCILTGFGTTVLFARAVALFGALKPRSSFIYLCAAGLFGPVVFSLTRMAPGAFATVMFALLPLLSAGLLVFGPYSTAELAVLSGKSRLTSQFWLFLVALFIFSLAAQVMRNGLYPLPPAQSIISTEHSAVVVFFIYALLALFAATSDSPYGFAKLYRPATLAIIALLIVVPLIDIPVVIRVALSSAANDTFNVLAWGMLAYIVFQAQGNALPVFCLGNAALAGGSFVGSLITGALVESGISTNNFLVICLALALVAIVVSLFIFPENKMAELLLPIDESEPAQEESGDRFAPWKAACLELAERGGLTDREAEIMALLARGKSTQQIADELVISAYTVRAHTRNIYTKLDVHSRNELADLVGRNVKQPARTE